MGESWSYRFGFEVRLTFSHITLNSSNFLSRGNRKPNLFCILRFKVSSLMWFITHCHEHFFLFWAWLTLPRKKPYISDGPSNHTVTTAVAVVEFSKNCSCICGFSISNSLNCRCSWDCWVSETTALTVMTNMKINSANYLLIYKCISFQCKVTFKHIYWYLYTKKFPFYLRNK